jgi:uncharacterized NAD(P)/FAD-binding protein YdhS
MIQQEGKVKKRIVIIGGGLSGRLLAYNLLQQAPRQTSTSVTIVDRVGGESMGPAYSNDSSVLLLNVPAGKMSAISEDPEHFCQWVKERGRDAKQGDFLPRKLYREYILSLMHEAARANAYDAVFELVRAEATDVEPGGQCAVVHLEGRKPLTADRVVLAIGNFPPRNPAIAHASTFESERYVRNPWKNGILDSLHSNDPVVFIGTGQTMIDLSLMLHQRGHQGRIIGISRRGLLPMAHQPSDPYPSFFEEIRDSESLVHIFSVVRRHIEQAKSMGIPPQAVIDSLRPDTQALWHNLPESEKSRFLRHVFRYWERIRSRIPPESKNVIDKLRAAGQLRIVAGRIYDIVDTGHDVQVHYVPRRRSGYEAITAGLVVNCIGPESDYRRIDHPLVKSLMRRGLIRPGPANLGIAALRDGEVVSKAGDPSGVLYTLGSTMKGLLWEVLAVPDIRLQAENLARLLLRSESPGGVRSCAVTTV